MSLLSPGLQAFLAIVRLKTVHSAAAQLGLTQTAVTQRIRALENSLDVTLFLRSRKGMRPTEEGEALLQYCLGAEELEGAALSGLQKSGVERKVSLTIAGPTSIMAARVAPQCQKIHNRWPRLSLNFLIDDSENRIELLKRGAVQMALLRPHQVSNELESQLVRPEQFILVGHPSWKKRRLSSILEEERIVDFHEKDPTTFEYLKKFGLMSHVKRDRLFANNNEVLIRHFCSGVGFGTLTKDVARPLLESGKLIKLNRGAEMNDPMALAWYPRPNSPPYFREVLRAIQ